MSQPILDTPGPPPDERPVAAFDPAPEPPAPLLAPPPPPPPPPPPASVPVRHPSGLRHWLLSALVGGIVGALVASVVFVATDDDSARTTIVQSPLDTAVSRPSHGTDGDGDVAAIIAKVEPAVVAITTGAGPGTGNGGAGTGFVITPDGYIVTNHHVVDGATRITVAFTDGNEATAQLVGREVASDIAVLKVDASNLPTVELGDSDAVQVGDEVVAIGNALALEGGLSITRGIVSGLHRTVSTNRGTLVGMMQTDAAINPGNSGGPLVDADGRVIAINTAIANPDSSNNVGFAIPTANARPVIDDLRLGRPAAFLGVSTLSVTPAIARQQALGIRAGALVTRVTPGSAAAAAGIEEGDVILAIAGEAVTESSDVQALVRAKRPGDAIDVVIHRDGGEQTLRATLTERPTT